MVVACHVESGGLGLSGSCSVDESVLLFCVAKPVLVTSSRHDLPRSATIGERCNPLSSNENVVNTRSAGSGTTQSDNTCTSATWRPEVQILASQLEASVAPDGPSKVRRYSPVTAFDDVSQLRRHRSTEAGPTENSLSDAVRFVIAQAGGVLNSRCRVASTAMASHSRRTSGVWVSSTR